MLSNFKVSRKPCLIISAQASHVISHLHEVEITLLAAKIQKTLLEVRHSTPIQLVQKLGKFSVSVTVQISPLEPYTKDGNLKVLVLDAVLVYPTKFEKLVRVFASPVKALLLTIAGLWVRGGGE